MQATPDLTTSTPEAAARTPLSSPRLLLHIEGLTLFAAAVIAYAYLHGSGLMFAVLLLAPDLTFFAFLAGNRIGAWAYNIVHHPLLPGMLIGLALATGAQTALLVGLIWLAHIGMDRVAGYGYKYPSSFKVTHMQKA